MSYVDSGIFVLKRWNPAKGVEHYAVGLSGSYAWRVGRGGASIVQLLATGTSLEPWTAGAGWQVIHRAGDPEVALVRLGQVWNARFDLIGFNCEHFARFVVTGNRESRQVQGVALLGLVAVVLILGCR